MEFGYYCRQGGKEVQDHPHHYGVDGAGADFRLLAVTVQVGGPNRLATGALAGPARTGHREIVVEQVVCDAGDRQRVGEPIADLAYPTPKSSLVAPGVSFSRLVALYLRANASEI